MEFALMVILMGCTTAVAITGMIVWAFRNRQRPSALGDAGVQRLSAQLDAMQQQIDAMHVEVERVSEGQRFTTRVLTERTAPERIGG